MVVEASRAEYVANDKFRQQLGCRETSTSNAEPSSSGASKFMLTFDVDFAFTNNTRLVCLFVLLLI